MSKFDDCIKENDLGKKLEDQYGAYGHFTQESADTIIQVVRLEVQEPGPAALLNLAAMVATTWANESAFNTNPLPQVNCPCRQVWPHDKPICNANLFNVWAWDIGPLQMNLMWTHRMAWQGEIDTEGPLWKDVFGKFYEDEPVETTWQGAVIKAKKPAAFNGDLIANLRIGARRLLAIKGKTEGFESLSEMQVVKYTGPEAQPHRLRSWRKFGPLFREFFIAYELETA